MAMDIAHKAVVLRCLQAQCEDGKLLVDLFVNYDCDLEGANLFEGMVTALVHIAQGNPAHDATAQNALEEVALRYEALRCLVTALRALAAWHAAVTSTSPLAPTDAIDVQTALGAMAPEEVPEENLEAGWRERIACQGDVTAGKGISSAAAGPEAEQQRQAAMLGSYKAYKRQFHEGVRLFNQKPRKGVAFMLEQRLIHGEGPAAVADFLARTPGLNKTQIGDYLGEREEFSIHVMHSYVDALDFANLEFDEAIRQGQGPPFMCFGAYQNQHVVLLSDAGSSWLASGCRARRRRSTG